MLPGFNTLGVLPQGDYPLTLAQLRVSHLVVGNERSSTWDPSWRNTLVNNLEIMVNQLWVVGISEIFINGSFVEDKDHPNDIDGYFDCDFQRVYSGDLERALNLLDPYKIWTWAPEARKAYRGYPKMQLPMWHRYRIELYPHFSQLSGIRDKFGNELEFPSAFRQVRRNGAPKGIVKIIKSDL